MVDSNITVTTQMTSKMGAKITIASPGQGMYLVIGRDISPESPVRSLGGRVVLRLNGNKLLALLSFSDFLSLQDDYRISNIGPVTVDIERLTKISKMLAKTG